jgi:predicted ATPase/class 3 adenylate cyclase
MTCAACGYANREGSKFCSECGTALAPAAARRQERKTVTVLFCDLVGFTSRAERMDPEDVQAVLAPYHAHVRAELERFGGTVEKFIGDAVVAVFGAPVAREDDPERAVRAALAVGGWAREQQHIEVRIAVNTGEALVALEADPGRGEAMVAGDVVNTAARLQAAAPVNGVLAGETTYRATRDRVHYREAAAVAAKGKSKPVAVWEALQARARVEVERSAATPFVGRRRELEALREALARTEELREPQLVTLVGVPGIGKSRLVYELFRSVEQRPELVYWRRGRSLPYGEGVSFWALGEVVKAQAGILETDSAGTAEAKLHETVAGMLGDDRDAVWIERHLRPLAGAGADGAARGDAREEAFGAWRRFLEALAEQRPLVLVLEDLHWADEGMLDFVDHLLDWASDVPLLVVATARTELLERRPSWGGGKANALTLSLAPLTRDETSRLVDALLEARPLTPAERDELLARAEGNPLYAEEFARLAAEQERGERRVPVPESVQGIIAARLDALAPEEKELLQEASVVGRTFWLGALAGQAGRERAYVEKIVHGLDRKEFVRRERRATMEDEVEYSFRHALVRDVAYAQIPRARRAELHHRAAGWLEAFGRPEDHAELLAHHHLQALELTRASGGDVAPLVEPARRAFRQAGDRAFSLGALAAAEEHFERALELWPRADQGRAAALLGYARVVNSSRVDVEALQDARRELLDLADAEAAAEVAAMIAYAEHGRGNTQRAHDLMRETLTLLEDAPASRAKVAVLTELARQRVLAQKPDGIRIAQEAFAVAEGLGLGDLRARLLSTIGTGKVALGEFAGFEDMERSIAVAEEAGAYLELVRAHSNYGAMLANTGDIRAAAERHRHTLALARRYGIARLIRWVRASLISSEWSLGNWDDALAAANAFIAEVEAGSPFYQESQVRWTRADIRLSRGDLDGALEDGSRALAHSRALGDPQALHLGLCSAAFLHARVGNMRQAAALVDEVLGIARTGAGEKVVFWHALAFPLAALGRGAELVEAADADRRPSLWGEAARAFAAGDPAGAAELSAEIGSLPWEAYCRVRAGERLLAEGRTGEAEAQLQRALAFYRSVGATRDVEEIERLKAAQTPRD